MSHQKKEALLIDMNQRLSWIEYLSCKASAQALKSPISIPDQPLATLEELHRGPGEVLRPLPPDHAGLAEGAGKVSYPGWSKAQCRISRGNEQKGLIRDFISDSFAGGQHSSEGAFVLLTQQPRVHISTLPKILC